jgi:hypothetical protein
MSIYAPDNLVPEHLQPEAARTKIAEGEYVMYEWENGGAVGPFVKEVYNIHESWTLFGLKRAATRSQDCESLNRPRTNHCDRFVVELARDLAVVRIEEFAKLKWRPDSGPAVMRLFAGGAPLFLRRLRSKSRDTTANTPARALCPALADFAFLT